jgi:ParB family chromosome partitioning protein
LGQGIVSRQIFGKTPAEGAGSETPAVPVEPRVARKPLMGLETLAPRKEGQPVGAFGASLSKLNERGKHAEEIEKKLASGQIIVELDTTLIDPSFVSDRMPLTDAALSDLVDAIRESTQLSPILVRPHPDVPGRYQTAFGHRRVRAVSILGLPVRAIVRELTDEEMVVAQGQENHARKDLSYIEKAQFARRLENRQFSRATIMAALSIYKSDLSNMLSVAHTIPEELIEAIGPAPNTGRRGWIELAELLKTAKQIDSARKAAAAPLTQAQDSDDRFRAVLSALKPAPAKSKTDVLKDGEGAKIGKVASNAQRLVVTVDRKHAPAFADYLAKKLPDLMADFAKQADGKGGT